MANFMPTPVEQTRPQEDFTPFTDIATEKANEKDSLFPNPETEIPQSPYTEKGTDQQALLTALATQANRDTDEAFSSIVGRMKDAINQGQQPAIRENMAITKQDLKNSAAEAVQNDLIKNPSKYPDISVTDLIKSQQDAAAQGPDLDTLEEDAVTHMQNLGSRDPDQAALMSTLMKTGNALDITKDHVTKQALLNREFDKLSKEWQDSSLLDKTTDILGTLIPLRATLSALPSGKPSQLLNPGQALSDAVNNLMGLPLPEFKKQLPIVVQQIKDNSSLLLGENKLIALQNLEHYVSGVSDNDKITFDMWAALDASSIIPAGKIAAMGRTPAKMLMGVGNRSLNAEQSAMDIVKDIQGIDKNADNVGPVLGDTTAIEESLPSSVIPNTSDLVRPYVGASSDIADKIDAMQEGIKSASIQTAERFSPTQFQEAVQDAIKKAETKFKDDNIVDFQKAEVTQPGEVFLKGYHGTASDFAEYDSKLAGSATSAQDAKASGATFFSSDPEIASGYAEFAARDTAQTNTGANVRPVKINLKNPKIIDWNGEMYSLTKFKKLIPEAKAAGHDGVIIKNVNDSVKGGPRNSDIYAVFDPNKNTSPIFGGAKRERNIKIPKSEGDILDLNAGGQLPTPSAGEVPNDVNLSDLGLNVGIAPPSASVPEHDFRPFTTVPRFNVSTDNATGISHLEIYLGRKSGGGGYVSRVAAQNGALRRGLALEDVEIHQNLDGQYFIKTTQPISETGVATPILRAKDFHVGQISQWLKSPTAALPDDWGRALLGQTLQKTRIQKKVVSPLSKIINKTTDKKTLNTIIELTQNVRQLPDQSTGKAWMNLSELSSNWERVSGKPITEKDVLAYYAYKELSDFNWSVFDREAYVQRARRGMATVHAFDPEGSFDTGRVNGYDIETPDFASTRVFDLEARQSYAGGTNTSELQRKWDTGRYRLLQLEEPRRYNNEPVKFILVKKGDSSVGPLERRQLGYVPGGSREYPTKYFVKQARSGKFNDGKVYYLDPITHITAETKSQANKWADAMEAARKAWIDDNISAAMKHEIISRSPVENVEKWQQLVEEGTIQLDTPFETVFDKEQPKFHMRDQMATDWSNMDLSPADQYFMSKGRMYYSHKGEQLRDPSGEYATVLDPMTTLNRATNNAVRTMAFSDYNRKVIDEWSRVALPFIDKSSVGGNLNPDKIFFAGKLRKDLIDGDLYNKLEGARAVHNRFMALKTPAQSALDVQTRKLAEWVDGKGELGTWASSKILNNLSRNPIEAVNGFVFDSLFGFFNPAQLIVQTQTAATAMIANPRWGAQVAAMVPGILWSMKNTTPNFLDFIAKNTSLIHGLDIPEFKFMVKALRDNSFLDVGSNIVQLDQYTNRLGGSMLSRAYGQMTEAGRYPFYLAERINRAVAYQIAWREVRETAPELKYTSKEFLDRVLQRADDWSMNMTTASQAAWQKGALNIPTKYLGYQMKFLENVMGGNKRFTPAQRAKLMLGQTLLYGASGIPIGRQIFNWVSSEYAKYNNSPMDPQLYRIFSKGFFDTMMYYASGGELDTDFAYRVSQGVAWQQLYQRLSEGKLSSFFDVMGGPTFEISGQAYDNLRKVVDHFRAEQSGTLNAQDWALMANDVLKNISTYRIGTKALTIWKLGYLKDPNTGQPIVKATDLEGYAAALGIPLRGETERWEILNKMEDRENMAVDIAKQVADIRRKAFAAIESGDDTAALNFQKQATGLVMMYRDDPMFEDEIVRQTNKQLGYTESDWNSLVQKLWKTTGEEPPGGPIHPETENK